MMEHIAEPAKSPLREYLFGLTLHGMKLGLDNIRHLLQRAGDPQDAYPTVHVAGTNGKGSVLAFLMRMLQEAGYKTGRFTSPHLINVNERFVVDGVPINDEALDENIAYFKAIAGDMDHQPTFFEMCTAIAFRYFAQQGVDVALIEVGMGGRLDSTNVITPLATAVTSIALEHTQYLGDTVEQIAAEKGGILKAGAPAVFGVEEAGPRGVLWESAQRVGAPVRQLGEDFGYSTKGEPWDTRYTHWREGDVVLSDVPLGLKGRYQGHNAAIAVELADLIAGRFPRVDVEAVSRGLGNARWPGRFEVVLETPRVIIDVAHNVAGAAELARNLGASVVVLAVSSDKDATGMLAQLMPKARPLIVTQFDGKRSMAATELAMLAGADCICAEKMEWAIALGMREARANGQALVITGSIYAAGEARQILIEEHGAERLVF